MAEYRDYKSLENVMELKHGDIIYFGTMEYKVYTSSLVACFGNSDIIFSELDITDKYTFCNNVYRYKSNPGIFPNCYEEDYKALARIARTLMLLYEEKFGKQTYIPNTSESLFKVGDIEGVSLSIFDSKYTINSEPEFRIKINKKHYTI